MPAKSHSPQEVELKLEVAPSELKKIVAHPFLTDRSMGSRVQRLQSTYFDTPDHVLRKNGISLRIRRNGDQLIQTIKADRSSSGIALARSEWEHEVESDSLDYTFIAQTALEPFLAHRSSIQPAFRVLTERTLHTVSVDGSTVEVAVDAGEIEGKNGTVSFGELELELKDGTPADLFRLALILSASASLRLSFKTKAERGYEAASDERHTRIKASDILLKRKMTAATAFQTIGASCLQHLMANDAIVRQAPEADAVHQMRVALRRLRAAITLFKSIVDDRQRDSVRAELKWMANVLGEARDLDVYITNILEPAGDRHGNDEGFQSLLAAYRERRGEAYRKVQETIESPRFINGILATAAWIQAGDWLQDKSKAVRQRRKQPVAALAEDQIDRRWKKVIKRGKHLAELDPEDRHQVRIEIKKLRYATEFFNNLFKGRGAKKRKRAVLSRLEALQETLGELNDIAVGSHNEPSLLSRQLHEEQTVRVNGLLAAARQQYRELAGLEPFWRF